MRLEVSDEGGTEGFGEASYWGMGTAPMIFLLRHLGEFTHLQSWGCLLAKACDQSWKTQRSEQQWQHQGGVAKTNGWSFSLPSPSINTFLTCFAPVLTNPPPPPHKAWAEQQNDPCLLRGPPVLEKMKLVVWNPHRGKEHGVKGRKNEEKGHFILSVFKTCLFFQLLDVLAVWQQRQMWTVLWFEQKETNAQEIVSTYTEICYSVSFSVWNKHD